MSPRRGSDSSVGTTAEESLNDKLAELLRGYGVEAQAEQRIADKTSSARGSHKLDVAIELEHECIVLEAEFDPALKVKEDVQARLPASGQLMWRGLPITRTFALIYPGGYRRLPESRSKLLLSSRSDLRFQPAERITRNIVWGAEQTGSVNDLAQLLSSYWTQSTASASIDAIVSAASDAIDNAAAILRHVPYLQGPTTIRTPRPPVRSSGLMPFCSKSC